MRQGIQFTGKVLRASRRLAQAGILLAALGGVLGIADQGFAQEAGSATPAVGAEGLSDDILAVFGVDKSLMTAGGKELKEALEQFQQGNHQRTLELLENAHRANGELPPPKLLMSRLFFLANNVQVARTFLEQVVADDSNVPEAYLLFGRLALVEGRLTDAALQHEKAIQLAATADWSQERRSDFQSQCYSGLTSVAEQRQNWEAAQAAIFIWLRMKPDDASAHARLARALFNLKKSDEAFAELQKAVELNPEEREPEVSMGWLYTQNGSTKEAEEWMQKAAKKYPDVSDVRSEVSAWYLNHGSIEDAKEHAAAAAALDPESDALKLLNGVIELHRKNFTEAEQIFNELYVKSPSNFVSSNYLALALINSPDEKKRVRAAELAEINARQYPKSPDALSTLGWVYYQLGRLDDSEKLLLAAIEANEGRFTLDTAYYLAHVRFDREKLEDVKKLLESALAAPGRFIYRDEAQRWLDQLQARPKQRGPSAAPAQTEEAAGSQQGGS